MNIANPKLMTAMLAVAAFATTASAQNVFHVATAQDLQNALTEAAGDGADNIIYVTNGYYIGNFNYNSSDNTSLTIENESNATNNTAITIDGGGLGRDINITCGGSLGNVTISGITFMRNCGNYQIGALRIAAATGGNIAVGGCQFLSSSTSEGIGLEIAAGDNTTIRNCTITGKNITTGNIYDGNGINISGVTGNTLIYNNTISGNYDAFGANIIASAVLMVTNNVFQNNIEGGLNFHPPGSGIAQALVIDNVFNGNSGYGAGFNNFNTLTLSGNAFTGNNVGASASGGTAIVISNTIYGNYPGAGFSGAGLGLYVSSAIVTGNTFSGNLEEYNTGGGAYIIATTATVVGNTFNGNSDVGPGGGAYLQVGANISFANNRLSGNQASAGGGVYIYNSSGTNDFVDGNTFVGNSCTGNDQGGALCIVGSGTPFINGNTFGQNSSADGGGAIYVNTAGNVAISDNLVVNNSQSGGGANGGGILVVPSSTAYVVNNTIFGNTSGGGGGGLAFQTTGTQSLYVFNNIIWGNSATGNGGDLYLAGGGSQTELISNDVDNVSGVWDSAYYINSDPQFFNPVAGDFHFPESSPCANAGTNGAPEQPLTDLDGNNRTNNLGEIDLGCYEFNNTAPHPADTNGVFTITPGEYTAYAAAWKNGQSWTNFTSGPNPIPIPANYLTRAGYLMTNGGAYTNDGSARPTNWKLAQ
jgi:hypothetical protein